MANRERAVNMAARGASAQDIRRTTGVTAESARNIVSRAAPSPMPAATTPSTPTRPANIPASSVDAGTGKSYDYRFIANTGRDGMGVWAAGPRSDEEVRALYPQVSATQAPATQTSPSNAAETAAAPGSINRKNSVDRNLKIAGIGGIGAQELQSISKTSGRSGAQVVQRLDALNQKLKGNDQVGINLNSGAANMLIREAITNPTMDSFYKYGGKPTFGTGKIGQTLEGMLGTRSTGGYINKSGQQSITPGTERTLLARGMDLMPSGRQTVRGIGQQFAGMPTAGEGTMMPAAEAAEAPIAAPIAAPEMLPELPPEEEKVDQMMPGSSADLANWATGFKTARSSRKRSGPRAQGLASQRVNPTGAFRGGM